MGRCRHGVCVSFSIDNRGNCRCRIAPSDDDDVQVAGSLHFEHRRGNHCSGSARGSISRLDEIDGPRAQRVSKRAIGGYAALIRIGYGDIGSATGSPGVLAVMVVLFGTATLPAGRPSNETTAPF